MSGAIGEFPYVARCRHCVHSLEQLRELLLEARNTLLEIERVVVVPGQRDDISGRGLAAGGIVPAEQLDPALLAFSGAPRQPFGERTLRQLEQGALDVVGRGKRIQALAPRSELRDGLPPAAPTG